MLYTLLTRKVPADTFVIGPIRFCGYIPLINDLNDKNNCKSIIGVVEGRLRVIIYTTKKILCGEQLGYYYERGRDDVKIFEKMISPKTNIKIKNVSLNCYANVILQFLYKKQ